MLMSKLNPVIYHVVPLFVLTVLAKETVLKQYGLLVDQHSQTLDRITRWPPHKGEDGQAAAPSSTISDVASNVPDVPLLLPCSEAYEGAVGHGHLT